MIVQKKKDPSWQLEQWVKKLKCSGCTGTELENFPDIRISVVTNYWNYSTIRIVGTEYWYSVFIFGHFSKQKYIRYSVEIYYS